MSVRMSSTAHTAVRRRRTVASAAMAVDHQNQLPKTPSVRTRPATKRGVSAEKLVATSEVPATHHGSDRPAR